MKPINKSNLILSFFLFFYTGCGNEYTIITRVNPDGTIERTLIAKSDNYDNAGLPISVDLTWLKTEKVDTAKEKPDTFYVFWKRYPDSKTLDAEYSKKDNKWSLVNRSVNIRKKFRWFYTFFEYKETYGALFPGQPIDQVFSPGELALVHDDKNDSLPILAGLDSLEKNKLKDSLEMRYWEWLKESIFISYFDSLKVAVGKLPANEEYTGKLLLHKDELLTRYKMSDADPDTLFDLADSILQAHGDIVKLKGNKDSSIIKVEAKIDLWEDLFLGNQLTCELIMPGMLTSANADSIKSDTLKYLVNWEYYFAGDYVMKAETRIINKWTFVVSGFIVLLACMVFVFGSKKKN